MNDDDATTRDWLAEVDVYLRAAVTLSGEVADRLDGSRRTRALALAGQIAVAQGNCRRLLAGMTGAADGHGPTCPACQQAWSELDSEQAVL